MGAVQMRDQVLGDAFQFNPHVAQVGEIRSGLGLKARPRAGYRPFTELPRKFGRVGMQFDQAATISKPLEQIRAEQQRILGARSRFRGWLPQTHISLIEQFGKRYGLRPDAFKMAQRRFRNRMIGRKFKPCRIGKFFYRNGVNVRIKRSRSDIRGDEKIHHALRLQSARNRLRLMHQQRPTKSPVSQEVHVLF